jgi:hypothetical protein
MDELDAVTAEIEAEQELWKEARLPAPGQMWRMGDGEFQYHCHTEALVRLIREIVGEDKMNLVYKQVILEELKTMRRAAADVRSQALRNAIVDGIDVIRPPEI